MYGKCPKILNTLLLTFCPKFCFLCSSFLNYLNIADPDQTAPSGAVWSGSALFAYVILSEILVYKILGQLPEAVSIENVACLFNVFADCRMNTYVGIRKDWLF